MLAMSGIRNSLRSLIPIPRNRIPEKAVRIFDQIDNLAQKHGAGNAVGHPMIDREIQDNRGPHNERGVEPGPVANLAYRENEALTRADDRLKVIHSMHTE